MGFFNDINNSIFSGGSDAPGAAMDQMKNIPGVYQKYLQPWVSRGDDAYNSYSKSLADMMKNGGVDFVNGIYNQYYESPQYKFAAEQAQNAAANAAAAGGTLGTGAHQAQLADYIQGLSSRDQGDFYNRVMGAYGQGLAGQNNIMNMGYNAGSNIAGGLSDYYNNMASLAYNQKEAQMRGAMNTMGMGISALSGGFGAPGGFSWGGALSGLSGGIMPYQNY